MEWEIFILIGMFGKVTIFARFCTSPKSPEYAIAATLLAV